MLVSSARPAVVCSVLSDDESFGLMTRNHTGRLAFINHGVVDIEPVSYVHDDGWLFLRSRAGTKLDATPWCTTVYGIHIERLSGRAAASNRRDVPPGRGNACRDNVEGS